MTLTADERWQLVESGLHDEWEERAAIMQYDGKLRRERAERAAFVRLTQREDDDDKARASDSADAATPAVARRNTRTPGHKKKLKAHRQEQTNGQADDHQQRELPGMDGSGSVSAARKMGRAPYGPEWR
jgi:hypothetical protein